MESNPLQKLAERMGWKVHTFSTGGWWPTEKNDREIMNAALEAWQESERRVERLEKKSQKMWELLTTVDGGHHSNQNSSWKGRFRSLRKDALTKGEEEE